LYRLPRNQGNGFLRKQRSKGGKDAEGTAVPEETMNLFPNLRKRFALAAAWQDVCYPERSGTGKKDQEEL
jgi:hypothetical protein